MREEDTEWYKEMDEHARRTARRDAFRVGVVIVMLVALAAGAYWLLR